MVSKHHLSNENVIPMSSTNQPTSSPELSLVVFNITTQINEKLTPSSFPQWRAQFEALLIGYDLLDYVNGESQCPLSDGTPQSTTKKKVGKARQAYSQRHSCIHFTLHHASHYHNQNLTRGMEKIINTVCK
jgi:hypothetical protein